MGSKEVALGVLVGVVMGADDTVSDIGEAQFWVGQGGAAEEGLEQTTAVLGVVGGDTTV